MDGVDRLGRLIGTLRKRVAETPQAARREHGAGDPGAAAASPPASLEALRHRVVERLGGLSPDGPGREARAVRIFVESVLVWEFGEELLADPQFAALVERVEETLAADESLRRQLGEVLRGLTD